VLSLTLIGSIFTNISNIDLDEDFRAVGRGREACSSPTILHFMCLSMGISRGRE
ncbi:hypothetical protein L9F63_022242, partial [Diploptera punctata]